MLEDAGSFPTRNQSVDASIHIDRDRNLIIVDGRECRVEPKVLDLFELLSTHPGEVFSREALIESVWHVEFGGDESLSRAISILRKTLREAGVDHEVIETIPKRGYRVVAARAGTSAPPVQQDPPVVEAPPHRRKSVAIFAAFASAVVGLIIGVGLWFSQQGNVSSAVRKETATAGVEASKQAKFVGLAVIPFVAMSTDEQDRFFAQGLSEELLNWLAGVEGLNVRGRSTGEYLQDKNADLQTHGKQLGIDYVLEGSVRRSGTSLRVTAQLVDVRTGYHVWSDTYTRDLTDLLAVQEDIARTVVTQLLGSIPDSGAENPAAIPGVDPVAHAYYLEGRALWTERKAQEALDKFRAATQIDPNHALAQAYAAIVLSNSSHNKIVLEVGGLNMREAANEALAKAIAVQPDSAGVIFASAWVQEFATSTIGEPTFAAKARLRAKPLYERAVRANPRHVEALHALARLEEEPDRKRAAFERVLAIDPLLRPARVNLANIYLERGDSAAAIQVVDEIFSIKPDASRYYAIWVARRAGDMARAANYAFSDWDGGNSLEGRMMRASILADLGAIVEAQFLYEQEALFATNAVDDHLNRVLASSIAGEAIEAASLNSLEDSPPWAAPVAAMAHMVNRDNQAALNVVKRARPRLFEPDISERAFLDYHFSGDVEAYVAAISLERLGRKNEARRLWRAARNANKDSPSTLWERSLNSAIIAAWLGEKDDALKSLRAAYDAGFRFRRSYACAICADQGLDSADGFLAPLLAEPEFKAIMKQIDVENEQLLVAMNERYGVLDKVHKLMAESNRRIVSK